MVSKEDRIKELEEEIRKTKYNKATQHHVGLVKAKIARLREAQQASGGGGGGHGYSVRKTGDATVIMVGFPSVGKSTLLNAITNAESRIGAYEFTTLDVVPGLLEHRNAKIQVLDVPGILTGAASGRGRGKEVLSVVRTADLVILLIDVFKPEHRDVLLDELYQTGLRVNSVPPDVKIVRKSRGGFSISSTVKQELTDETFGAILKEYRTLNADVLLRTNVSIDQFIDCIEGNRVYIPCISVLNKVDMVSPEEAQLVAKKIDADILISAEGGKNLDELKDLIFERLGLIRIYLKEHGKKADMEEPIIMREGCSIRDVCTKLHREFIQKFKYARIWGPSAKYPGQRRTLDFPLQDSDVLEVRLS